MSTTRKIPETDEAWDKGMLGRGEQFVAVSEEIDRVALDAALDLQMISIRLPKSLIEDFKLLVFCPRRNFMKRVVSYDRA
jgi:hypothetical protein